MNPTKHYSGKILVALLCLVFATQTDPAAAQSLRINEFMAANSSTISDPEYHEFSDWIEIYNAGTTSVNLNGFSITDNLSQPQKYRFTANLIIAAQSYMLIWCDDRGVNNHTNFKLSASGESIGLFGAGGTLIDTVNFGTQQDDISCGRVPDGSTSWFRLLPASPGSINLSSQIYNRLDAPVISHQSGFFPSALSLILSHPTQGVALYYTTDGHTPSVSSARYVGPIPIDSTTAVRVRAFKDGYLPSPVTTATFFIQDPTSLPVFALVTDPENFFSDTSGIYVEGTNGIIANCSTAPRNWNQDWERPVDLELFEADRLRAFKVSCGVKIYGGCARLYPEKSLAFYFRDQYGFGRLHYQLFRDMPINEYNNFVLRSSGQDWWRTMFRDGMAQTVIKQGMKIDQQDYRPSILFINGRYWGIHNIREKLNEHYIESHLGVNPDNVDLVEISKGVTANNGDLVAYNSLVAFLNSHNLSVQQNYDSVAALIDVNEYIDYTIAEIYAANGDWPGANMKLWRERVPTGKWRWMMYDMDFTFGGNGQGQYNTNTLSQATATNGPDWPNPPWSTLMLRKLLENQGFKYEFIQRFAVHLNTTFYKNRIHFVIDSLAAGIAAEIPRHKIRWPQSLSIGTPTWAGNIQIMKDFATLRPAAAMGHFTSKFSLAGTYTLIVRRRYADQGKIFAHGVELARADSPYVFFKGVPLKISAVPLPGYRFAGWHGALSSMNPETTIVLSNDNALSAFFEPIQVGVDQDHSREETYQLMGNYPNPFNATTVIDFTLPHDSELRLSVFDMLGREVEVLSSGKKSAGHYSITWNANNYASGIYLCRMRVHPHAATTVAGGEFIKTMKMILMK